MLLHTLAKFTRNENNKCLNKQDHTQISVVKGSPMFSIQREQSGRDGSASRSLWRHIWHLTARHVSCLNLCERTPRMPPPLPRARRFEQSCIVYFSHLCCLRDTYVFSVAWPRESLQQLKKESCSKCTEVRGVKVGQCAELSGEGCDSPLSCAPIFCSLERTDTKGTDGVKVTACFFLV